MPVSVIAAGQNILRRVFVRSTLYAVCGILGFSFFFIGISYYSQVSGITERLERDARQKAEFVANISAREIENKNYGEMERLLNAVAKDDHVTAAKAYSRFGQEFASDFMSAAPTSEVQFNEYAFNAAQNGAANLLETDGSIDYVLPVFRNGVAVGSVLVRVSKGEIAGIFYNTLWQVVALLGVVAFAFIPALGWLMYKATAGISEVTQAAKEATEGYLDCNLATDAPGEVGDLQGAFRHLLETQRSNIVEIERLAYTDMITGLANRAKLDKLAATMIDHKPGAEGAVLYVGFDRFKLINDMHGHRVGDEVMRQLAARLGRLLDKVAHPHTKNAPALARFSGDEFVAILPGLTDPDQLTEVSETVLRLLSRPVQIGSMSLSVSASAGFVTYPEQGDTAEEVMKNANLAMYQAKSASRGRAVSYSETLRTQANERELIADRLRHAVDTGGLEVFYQPKVIPENGRIVGSEALLRWNDEVLGHVSPAKFIPIAEERGLIAPIGRFVLQRALYDTKHLHSEGLETSVAVNVSPAQFQEETFIEETIGTVSESGVSTEKVELEITESSLMDYSDTVLDRIRPIREQGVKFAIDDFGTGYSCLSSLANMPFDTLKIDRSFIMDIATCADRRTIVELIFLMAHQLNLETVAEGIETPLQKDYLKAWGGTLGQGFLWSPAVAFPEYRAMILAQSVGAVRTEVASVLH